jgi:methylamine utilization protein MauE
VELIGVYLAACLLLVGAGVAKALRPGDTARALVASTTFHRGLRLGPAAARHGVRTGAVLEALLGVAGLVVLARTLALATAVSYGLFAVYVAIVRGRDGPLASCGCFGTPDTPATNLHVVVDAGLAAAALAVAIGAPAGAGRSMSTLLWREPWHGVPLVITAAVGAWVLVHVLSTLPRLQAVRHRETP